MSLRIIEISASDSAKNKIHKLTEEHGAIDYWYSAKNKDSRRTTRILIHLEDQQDLLDSLQKSMHKEDNWRLIITPVETTLPPVDKSKNSEEKEKNHFKTITISREELFVKIEKGTAFDVNFILLVFLSTIVATIGLLQNNVALVIGAMVIAPFLGPILALSFGAALGDRLLLKQALKTNFTGIALTFLITILWGVFLSPDHLAGTEITSRTLSGYDSIILALASGAAAVLSMTTGLSAALVGVMVAVALLPPAATAGLLIGAGLWDGAMGATLLLLTNIVCVGLAAQLVFLYQGVKPRTWYMRKKSEQSVRLNLFIWGFLLLSLVVIMSLRIYL